jgi:uncharacterized damage-inducible protein DinB
MFSVELYRTLFAYHWHTTRRLLECAAKVGEADYTARPEDGRASLHEVLFHLLRTDYAWRYSLEHGRQGEWLRPEDFPDLAAIRSAYEREEQGWGPLAARWGAAEIEGDMTIQRLGGQSVTMPLWRMLQHLILHGMQHHAEVAALLTAYGQSPGDIDFLYFQG